MTNAIHADFGRRSGLALLAIVMLLAVIVIRSGLSRRIIRRKTG